MGLTHRSLLAVVGVLLAVAVTGVVLLWPAADAVDAQVAPEPGFEEDLIDATIVDVEPVGAIDDPGLPPGAQRVVLIAEREDTGEMLVFPMVDDTGDLYQPGTRVRLQELEDAEGEPTYLVADFRRGPALIALSAMFVLAVLAFARLQGLRALIGLGVTFTAIIGFIVPAILAGRSPVLVALTGSVLIMVATLYLSHGFNPKTTAAVVGTAAALATTVGLATLFVELASLTGFTSEEARLANVEVGGISLQGLLLAGIIIGALGVLDDVTMSQSSTVFALHRSSPGSSFGRLVGGALSVGRDHVAATVNTLFLAYAGASLPLLILFVTGPIGVEEVLTGELVAVEAVRTLVGSIGLIAAVPVTTLLAAALVSGGEEAPADSGYSHEHGLDAVAAGLAAPADPDPAEPGPSATGAAPPPPSAAEEPRVAEHGDAEQSPELAEPVDEDEAEWEARLRRAYGLPGEIDDQRGG